MNRDRAPPPPPPAPGQMPRGPGMMPGMMPGQQRPQQFQGPPPQQFNPQQQHFQGPPQQFRGPILHQDDGPRYPADLPLNGLATIHSIVPAKQKTEKDFRKELTVYEVYKISPSKISGTDKKETTKNDKKDKKDKKTSESKGSWTEAMTVQQFFDKKDIETTIKRLDAKDSATKKMKELGPNQTAQISYILDNKLLQGRDPQFEWIVAQLERDFYPTDKNGKKFTRSITVYLKRWPKDNVDCMDLVQRRKMQERQHLENQRMVQQQQQQAQQQQHQMRMQQAQQEHAERMNPTHIMGPMGPGGPGPRPQFGPGARGHGGSPAGVRIVEMSDSDGKSSSSNSDTNSDSGSDSETDPSSISSSRSGRRRKDKQYYGRGNARGGRSRSRSRNCNKDYTIVAPRRRADSRMRGMPRVPDSPRDARERSRSRPDLARRTTYNGRPSVEVHERTSPHFFDVPHSPIMQQRPILHQPLRDSFSAAAATQEAMADILAKGVEIGMKAGQQANVRSDALTLQRPAAFERDIPRARPPMPHSVSDYIDLRQQQSLARAEAFQRRDDEAELAARYQDLRVRGARPRSPFRNQPRDVDRIPRFAGADFAGRYHHVPMSPSVSSAESAFSHSSRGTDLYASGRGEYDYRRGEGSRYDSDRDREEYDFVGRDEANPFRPRNRSRPPLSRPPMPSRRASYMSGGLPYPPGF